MSNENKCAEDIFHAAREIASLDQRRDFLDDACAETPDLREQVEGLLNAYTCATNFLEHPPDDLGIPLKMDSTGNADLVPTQPPKPAHQSNVNIEAVAPPAHRFGDYELIERIACGGMGMVYKARQISLNRIVAIKMILAGQFASDDEVQRFYGEAQAAANLDHPGIVPVFDVGSCDNQHYFSMGFVDGESLAAKLKKEGPLPPRVAAKYVIKIAAAAQFAHEHGIVHRDLKPGNVLLDKSGEPRISDFGLAKRVEADSALTATGMVMGTPCYMPPEQASGKLEQITASADVYSLGAILYALITGRPPFDGNNAMETLMQVVHEEPISPRQIVATVPKDLEAICLKCLEKEPPDRYPTAAELAADLQQFLAGDPIRAKNDLTRRLRKWTLREPVLAAHLVTIFVLMAMILINYWVFGQSNDDSFRVLLLNQGILGALAVVAILLQKTHNAIKAKNVLPLIWAAMNPLFLTAALCANESPRAALLSLYLLLIITTGFFRRVELVAMTTITSLVGYVILVTFFPEREPKVTPPSYQVIFGASLVVTGILLGYQVLRLKRLSQKDAP